MQSKRGSTAKGMPDYWRHREDIIHTLEQKLGEQRRGSAPASDSQARARHSVQGTSQGWVMAHDIVYLQSYNLTALHCEWSKFQGCQDTLQFCSAWFVVIGFKCVFIQCYQSNLYKPVCRRQSSFNLQHTPSDWSTNDDRLCYLFLFFSFFWRHIVLQIRPRSSSLSSRATQMTSGHAVKQPKTPQPAPRTRSTSQPKTSTPNTKAAVKIFTSK